MRFVSKQLEQIYFVGLNLIVINNFMIFSFVTYIKLTSL